MINVYSARDGYWSVAAKIALAINVLSVTIMVASFLAYEFRFAESLGRFWGSRVEHN
jgi:hypothetical protein